MKRGKGRPKKEMTRGIVFHIRMAENEMKDLLFIAELNNASASEMVRRLIASEMIRYKRGKYEDINMFGDDEFYDF